MIILIIFIRAGPILDYNRYISVHVEKKLQYSNSQNVLKGQNTFFNYKMSVSIYEYVVHKI